MKQFWTGTLLGGVALALVGTAINAGNRDEHQHRIQTLASKGDVVNAPFVGPENGVWTIDGLSGVGVMLEVQNDQVAIGIQTYDAKTGDPLFLTSYGTLVHLSGTAHFEGDLFYSQDGSCLTCDFTEPNVDMLPGGTINITFLSPVSALVSFFGSLGEHVVLPKGIAPSSMNRLLFGYSQHPAARFAGAWLAVSDISRAGGPVFAQAFNIQKDGDNMVGCPLFSLATGECTPGDLESFFIDQQEEGEGFVAHHFKFGNFGFTTDEYRFAASGARATALGEVETIGFSSKGGDSSLPAMMVRVAAPGHFDNPTQVVSEPGAWAVAGLGGVGFELDMQNGVAGLGAFTYEEDTGDPISFSAAVAFDGLGNIPLDLATGGSCLNCDPGTVTVIPGAGGMASLALTSMDQGSISFAAPIAGKGDAPVTHELERLYFSDPLDRLLGKWALVSDRSEGGLFVGGLIMNFTEVIDGVVMGCRAKNLLDAECDLAFPISATAQSDGESGVIISVDSSFLTRDYSYGTVGVDQTSFGMAVDTDDPENPRLSRGIRLLSASAMSIASQ